MAKRKKAPSTPHPMRLIMQLHEQLKQCDPLPPPWDAYQSDNPIGYHNLTNRLLDALRISAFGPTRHDIKGATPTGQVTFWADRCWAIKVMPSFHNWGQFAVFESRSLVRLAFVCKGDLPGKPRRDYVVMEGFRSAKDWTDPVIAVLNTGPLAPTPDRSRSEGDRRMTLDGIGYVMEIATEDVRTVLRFSNPKSEHYRNLTRAAYQAAVEAAKTLRAPQISSFLKTWSGYSKE